MRPNFHDNPKPEVIAGALTAQTRARLEQAITLHRKGQLAQAQALYLNVLQIEPRHADALHLLGVIAVQTKNPQAAVELIGRAIILNPNDAAFYSNLGNALKELEQLDAAVDRYDKALALKPDYAEAWYNRADALIKLLQLDAAVESYDKAITLNPGYVKAYSDRGNALMELGQLGAAIESYDKAIAIKPDYANACWNKSLALLLLGQFEKGWDLYESRWNVDAFRSPKRGFKQPLWLGRESIAGKTILLHSEQGFGDTIQFCRYVKLVYDLGARVILEVEASLANLLKDLAGVSVLVVKGTPLPAFDCHCPLLSLPLALMTGFDTIPCASKYLSVDTNSLSAWTNRLGKKRKPRVGLVWSGSAEHANDHNRSISLSELIDQLPTEYQYVSLQKEVRDSDKAAQELDIQLLHFGSALEHFGDTAALCELMDIVISVDTSVAHLAAALGKPTWVLLPLAPDWRWLLDREDSPWYPSVKLYRQTVVSSWGNVLAKVRVDLGQFAF